MILVPSAKAVSIIYVWFLPCMPFHSRHILTGHHFELMVILCVLLVILYNSYKL